MLDLTAKVPAFHRLPWLPLRDHILYPGNDPFWERYTFKVPIWLPYIWYQKRIHFVVEPVAENKALISCAFCPRRLGKLLSIKMYLPEIIHQGLVSQNTVSLTKLLVEDLLNLTVFTKSNAVILSDRKIVRSFGTVKLPHIFSAKMVAFLHTIILTF